MNNLSKKTFIAIEAVLYIACNTGGKPVRSKEICEYQGVTLRYLEHILQNLVHVGILKGVRGPKGGYLLARDRRKIILSDIFDSMQSISSGEEKQEFKSPLCNVVIEPLWQQLVENIRNHLSSISILDLCDQAQKSGISGDIGRKPDFII